MPQPVVLLARLQVVGLAQNREILLHPLVGLPGSRSIDLRKQRLEFASPGVLIGKCRLRDALIETRQALPRAPLGSVCELHLEQHVGIGIAALDPRLPGGICLRCRLALHGK